MDNRVAEGLYLLNATVLIVHEIDSAYWHEWRLLHLPGDIQLFLLLHLPLIPLVLLGYRAQVRQSRHARTASLLLAATGLGAVLLHGVFIAAGDRAFTLPLSLGLLAATLILSLLQGGLAWRRYRV